MTVDINKILVNKILVLDGGFGTMLQKYNLEQGICNDMLSITHPEIVSEIHNAYLEAGADIISTNSFNANAISLADYALSDQAYNIARAAASVAKKCAIKYSTKDKPRYVAGSMGPTNRTLSMSADVNAPAQREVTYTQMYEAYFQQAKGLVDGGVDLILIETIFDTLNAKAVICAVRDISPDIPVMISATVSDASGRTLTGQTIEAFYASIAHARPITVGLNCGFGAKHLLPYLRRLAQVAQTGISVHPNAGLPNVMGTYDETPEMFANDMREFMAEGLVNIVGGCCGTTPDHIRLLAEAAKDYKPRSAVRESHTCVLSGLEPLSITPEANFINIGERTNVAGSAKFARLIREGNYTEALQIAAAQVQAGAQIVDVCMDDAMIDAPQAMLHFLNLMASEPEISRVPVMIDSSKWPVIETGLQAVQGKSIVNSISLKEGENAFIEKAIKIMGYGAAAVVMLFDEKGQADTYERKIEVARRAYDLLLNIGFPPEDIIFDPNVLAIATGISEHDRYARDFIDATRWIKQNLPYAKVSGGVSNLSFSFRGNNALRKAMHAVFLYHAIAAGMDMAIVNPQMVQLYDDIDPELLTLVEDLILYKHADAAERLQAHAEKMLDTDTKKTETDTLQWRQAPVNERITRALLKGDSEYITADTLEAYEILKSAVGIIDTILMPAMAQVGDLFAKGKMFLPQVVKSARVMKLSVAAIEPYIAGSSETEETPSSVRPTVVIATVKGDVHDIGKNIVALVLACNGYNVIDLGVMVPAETIISEAIDNKAAAICLSGLITPSLDEMIHVAKEAERRGLTTPIVVGGATTSPLHTALKIASVTKAPVLHSTDAANNASLLSMLLSENSEAFIASKRSEQQKLIEDYNNRNEYNNRRLTQALHKGGCPCCGHQHSVSPDIKYEGTVTPSIQEVEPYINWGFFFAGWGLPGKYPEIFSHPQRGEEAKKLYDDACAMLDRWKTSGEISLKGVIRTFNVHPEGNDIVFDLGDGSYRLPMLRNSVTGECVTDFLETTGDKVTLFAITAGIGLKEITAHYHKDNNDYHAIMAKLLCDRLTEAFAEAVLPGGCRIAFGYPSAPDHSLKDDVFKLIDAERQTPMRLTENYMINPPESICGIWLKSGHFIDVGTLSADDVERYAKARSMTPEEIRHLLGSRAV